MSTWMGSTVAAVWARSGAYNQPDECSDHDEHPHDDGEADLDAYIARLATAAPPLSSQQRDTLALLLRRR
jgi:hypothetical protein